MYADSELKERHMTATLTIPGFTAGTWKIDPSHSEVGFSVRHLMISKVRGVFDTFDATFVTTENPLETSVTATAEVASVNTKDANRDAHLRTGDFFGAEQHPTLSFVSTGVRQNGADFIVDGNLTMRGVSKPVAFDLEFGGFGQDPYGNVKFGATAKADIRREDFGLNFNAPLETGGVLLGEIVTITIEIQAVLQHDN